MPRRGLENILTAWPSIRRCVPNATLEVYYGFTELDRSEAAGDPSFKRWMDFMLSALSNTEGVIYHGMVGHRELAVALSRSGFYLYPTAYPETSCISLMKAQACGAVPITSRQAIFPQPLNPSTPPPFPLSSVHSPTCPTSPLIRALTHVPHLAIDPCSLFLFPSTLVYGAGLWALRCQRQLAVSILALPHPSRWMRKRGVGECLSRLSKSGQLRCAMLQAGSA